MFNPQAYENSRPDGFSVLEIINGRKPGKSQPRQFVPLKRTELKGQVIGLLAGLRLIQTFSYTAEQSDKVLEAVYRFPLPGDAAVTSVRVRFGDVEIRAELKERSQAETTYKEAKKQGRQAALLTRESPDVFTLQVAGIQPGQDITIETAYVQLARAEGTLGEGSLEGWSLRIPLTTSPRYVRSDEITSRHAQGQPLFLLRDPGHRFGLDLTFHGAATVESSTHRLAVTKEDERDGSTAKTLRVRLQDGDMLPDRDCVLSWKPPQQADRAALEVWLHDDRATEQVYFLALVAPPATHDLGRGTPREVVFLVDHSGSMQGPKWQAADWAVERFLSDLTERDAFALGLFHNTTRWLDGTPRPASAREVAAAVAFLKQHTDSGGTELGVALEQALDLKRGKGDLARHVLVITDAEVSDAGRILRLADQQTTRAAKKGSASDRRRISVLCIDAAPNAHLATELAERGGGLARFLTSDPDQNDITTALEEVLADWAEPVVYNLRLEVNASGAEVTGRESLDAEPGWSAFDLGGLPAGRCVWVTGRAPRGQTEDLEFRISSSKQREIASCKVLSQEKGDERPAIRALFGARRIRGLEYLMHSGATGDELKVELQHLGYVPAQVLAGSAKKPAKVYAENVREDIVSALRGLLVEEAINYGLASAETAFVAVRTEAGKPVEATVAVANALPAGWSGAFLGGYGTPALMSLLARGPLPSAPEDLDALEDFDASEDFDAPATALAIDLPRLDVGAFTSKPIVVFSGVPKFIGSEATLFDSAAEAQKLPEQCTIALLRIRVSQQKGEIGSLDAGLCLLIFVDDLTSPRARVRLADIVRQRGERPLNLLKLPGQAVRIVLTDPNGAWAKAALNLEVALEAK
jgi:Ca-activated chloride channel family protein